MENNFHVSEGDEPNKFCIKESPMGNEAISHMFYTSRYHHDEGKHDDKFIKTVGEVVNVLTSEIKTSEQGIPENWSA